jgi:uncharacterized protein (TIGR02611 family)
MNDILNKALKQAWRLIVLVAGGTILLAGIAMIVLPGPATVVIPVGLAVLGTEFLWARRLLARVKASAAEAARSLLSPKDGGKKERTGAP